MHQCNFDTYGRGDLYFESGNSMSTYTRKKKQLVVVYSAAMTDLQMQKMIGQHGDQRLPDVQIHGHTFSAEQNYIRYNSDIGGKLRD
jgi:hypothetical protein